MEALKEVGELTGEHAAAATLKSTRRRGRKTQRSMEEGSGSSSGPNEADKYMKPLDMTDLIQKMEDVHFV